MKLRNKKTGEIVNLINYIFFEVGIRDDRWSNNYKTITELNEEWEDYTPKEPLIKDEKIRKAVRAWAEANNIRCVAYHKCSHYWYLRAFNDNEQAIDFWLSYNAEPEMNEDEFYTIAELCGDEE